MSVAKHRAGAGEAGQGSEWVVDFADGSKDMRELLGGKGANVAEMTRVLGADKVPAGFTITTEACVAYMRDGTEPDGMAEEVAEALHRLQEQAGKTLGDPEDPLLVSVRSGARESMPGMLDTVLNLGLNDQSVEGLANVTGNERFAWDSYRRLLHMFGNVVRGIDEDEFETEGDPRELVEKHKRIVGDFPQDPQDQLREAIRAVFDSWQGERAVAYRRAEGIPDEWGTAVNVQQMVFGNKGETSGSGVAFSRDFATGAPGLSGDFLIDAQGEDVVSGNFSTLDMGEMAERLPGAHKELVESVKTLERHYRNMQDVEFTVEEGQLFFLQTRDAKRPPAASVRFAVDAVSEGMLSVEQALLTFKAGDLEPLLHEQFDPDAKVTALGKGVGASPGAAKGVVVFTKEDAVASEEPCILVRPKTRPDDYAGMAAAAGILTVEGGHGSHAALVARGKGWPCVIGVSDMRIDLDAKRFQLGGKTVEEGDRIAIEGTSGIVTLDDVPLVAPERSEAFDRILAWCAERRALGLGVRANADVGEDARTAVEHGAEGIGLCRSEHVLMTDEHKPKVAAVIMAADADERAERLDVVRPLQRAVFEELFEAMADRPVTVRLLDPPSHEFLPDVSALAEDLGHLEERYEVARYEQPDDLDDIEDELDELRTLYRRVAELTEENPMLGTRGCRLGILSPEIYAMQVHALFEAVANVRERALSPRLEIMVPLVDYEQELATIREQILGIAAEHGMEHPADFTIGTMIELPRACFVANLIAEYADFFSFGTNDLTQTALGFSRDDVESAFVPVYLEKGFIDRSPFETIDRPGVGWLVRLAAWVGRETKHDLKLGICGEHGGDPASIEFFHEAGLDYVSCSPFRVPIARVAAAQAAIRAETAQAPSD